MLDILTSEFISHRNDSENELYDDEDTDIGSHFFAHLNTKTISDEEVVRAANTYSSALGELNIVIPKFLDRSNFSTVALGQINKAFIDAAITSFYDAQSEPMPLFGSVHEENLLEFPLEFRASKELKKIILDSHIMLRSSAEISTRETLVVGGSAEFATELSRKIVQQFVLLAQELRYGPIQTQRISLSGSFAPNVQIRMCDSFLIVPDKSKDFLDFLLKDISTFISLGGKLSGEWGAYSLINRKDLYLSVAPSKNSSDDRFTKAKRLE